MDSQHAYADGEGAFRLHAVTPYRLVLHNVAILGDVPRSTLILMPRLDGIGSRLDVYACSPERHEGEMQYEAEDGP